uniref:Uncharacterized protein n=1 Tax=Romanomermis culicivorax TaxID=13658 RepID=A0A915I816_ROMCU
MFAPLVVHFVDLHGDFPTRLAINRVPNTRNSMWENITDPDPKRDPKLPDYFAGPGPDILKILDPEPDPIFLKFCTRARYS